MKAEFIKNKEKGVSALEMLIALTLIIISISAAVLMSFGNQSTLVDSQTYSEAAYIAQAFLEKARIDSRQDFHSVKSKNLPEIDIYKENKLEVSNWDSFGYIKKAVANVQKWNNQEKNYVRFSTLLADYLGALGGDTCNPVLGSGWDNPQKLGMIDVGENNGGTDVKVANGKAYITTDSSSYNKSDFYIVDVRNPNVLSVLGELHTGPGLASVQVAGRYAYVANKSTVSQLQVIDVSNVSNPTVIASLKVTPAGDTAVGNTIFYKNRKVYLGLTKSSGPEFFIIDVSEPSNPFVSASFEINTKINAITIKDNIAYLAVPDDPSTPAIAEQLKILDISQSNIVLLNSFGPNPSTMSGQSLYMPKGESVLYLGEGGANPANKPQLFALNVSDPNNIVQIASKYISTSNDVSIRAIVVRSNFVFLWTSDTNAGFQIWDLNNLNSPEPYAYLNTQQTATGGFDCDGEIIYTAQTSNKALQIIGPYQPSVYTLSNSGDISVTQGETGKNIISAVIVSGYPSNVSFSVSGLPAGASANFNPASCAPNCSTELIISTSFPTTPVGTYPITVTGAGGKTTSFNLIVNASPFDYILSNSGDIIIPKKSTGSVIITRVLIAGQTIPVSLNVSGLPNHVSVKSISTNPCAPTCSSTITIEVKNSAQSGTYNVTVTGSPPGLGPRLTSFKLTIP